VRLLLDAHISGRHVGRRLVQKGHDVLALDGSASYEGLSDEEVLALASDERRILLTRNVDDFSALLREWAAESRSHAGVILVFGIRRHEYRLVIDGVLALLSARPAQEAWTDICEALSRSRFES
jgi:nucleoside-diphosphate-sugar epimerase